STDTNNLFSNGIITDKMEFINMLFKNLSGLLEIREIKNGQASRIWLDSWKDIEGYDPPDDKNIYIGMFTRSRKKGTRKYCKHTRVLWADYDNMSLGEVKYRIDMSKLPGPSMIINSGHGIHCYWKLDKPAGPEIEPVVKAIANNTAADGQATDIARVMRLPGTMNVKDDPVRCKIIEKNNKIYSLEDIAGVLGVKPERPQEATEGQNKPDIDYQSIISKVDRPCIKSILEGVEEGERNFTAGRLIMYFRNIKGYSKRKTKKIIQYWNTLNKPPENERKLLNDFRSYWKSEYNLLGCRIPDNITKQQIINKYCNKDKCNIYGQFRVKENRRMVNYNNRIIKRLKNLHGTSLIMYGVLEKHPEGLTRKRIMEIANIGSKMTFYRRIKELININFVFKRKGIRQRGIPDIYKVVKQGTYGTGRTSVSYGAVIAAANGAISPAQYKVYLLLHWYLYIGQTNDIYPSTFTLAEKLGKSQSTIQNHITELKKKDFIQVDKAKEGYNIYYLQV
ncbi:MAG: helix-turn-helix domain-containing protein, partial [Halanaerobiales bacterium]|nr:helix-turn-helix domain-containing protein [Halanaerobiales bacterium]